MKNEVLQFPPDFTFGAATSAFQIEGALDSYGRGECIWQRFSADPGNIEDGRSAAVACDHYHRYEQDFDLLQDLSISNYRFSVSWPRILPAGRGVVNPEGLDFYDRLTDSLLVRGITPWVTLFHWDLPQALQDEGGWTNRSTIEAFAEYSSIISSRLGDRVRHWITHNEPWVVAFVGHLYGAHAPGITDLRTALQTAHGILVSHGKAVDRIRANVAGASIGISHNLEYIEPAGSSQADIDAATRHDGAFNRWFLDPLFKGQYPEDMLDWYGENAPELIDGDMDYCSRRPDFLGVNFYTRRLIRHSDDPEDWPGGNVLKTAQVYRPYIPRGHFAEWEMNPDGLFRLLDRLHSDYDIPPIYITENGTALPDYPDAPGRVEDPVRIRYLARHLAAAHEARRTGVDVRGYFVWSILDNFEWAFGYTKRFGLVHVDYEIQKRTVKQSGRWYADVCRSKGFSRSDADHYLGF